VRFGIPKGTAGLFDIGKLALPAQAQSEHGTNNPVNK
jgi:hypothetical protein